MESIIYNLDAKEVGKIELKNEIFGQEYNEAIIHEVIVAHLANKRQGTKSTLTRSEVRGGGRKPWRQKGTGRARQGSTRAPQWIKGGVVFAPKPRDFSKKVNKRVKFLAILSALSAKVAAGEFKIVENFDISAPKTKEIVKVLKAFNIEKKMLIVTTGNADVAIAARNIQTVKTINVDLINVYDLAVASVVLITKAAVDKIQEEYAVC